MHGRDTGNDVDGGEELRQTELKLLETAGHFRSAGKGCLSFQARRKRDREARAEPESKKNHRESDRLSR